MTTSTFLPLARRRESTRRPSWVSIRARKPCFLLLLMFLIVVSRIVVPPVNYVKYLGCVLCQGKNCVWNVFEAKNVGEKKQICKNAKKNCFFEEHLLSLKKDTSGGHMLNQALLNILVCPQCKCKLEYKTEPHEVLICEKCSLAYPVKEDIPVLLPDEAKPL